MTKTAIVTGGDGDIGKAIARGLREIDRDVATVDGTETVHKTAADLERGLSAVTSRTDRRR